MIEYAYVGWCRTCGGIVMQTLDNSAHAKDIARDVARVIRRGGYIERWMSLTVTALTAKATDCTCEEE